MYAQTVVVSVECNHACVYGRALPSPLRPHLARKLSALRSLVLVRAEQPAQREPEAVLLRLLLRSGGKRRLRAAQRLLAGRGRLFDRVLLRRQRDGRNGRSVARRR